MLQWDISWLRPFYAFHQFVRNIGTFYAHDAFLSTPIAQQVDTSVPNSRSTQRQMVANDDHATCTLASPLSHKAPVPILLVPILLFSIGT
jgi:hypothetical protein